MIVTPSQTAIAMAKVTMMWLVKVKLPGIIPSMLPIRMNMKIVNTIGKKRMPSLPVASRRIPATNSYIISTADCSRPGTMACWRVPAMISR